MKFDEDCITVEERQLHENLIGAFTRALGLHIGTMCQFSVMETYGPIVQRVVQISEKHKLVASDNRALFFKFAENAVGKAVDEVGFYLDIELVGPKLDERIRSIRLDFASSLTSFLIPRYPAALIDPKNLQIEGSNRNGNPNPRNG